MNLYERMRQAVEESSQTSLAHAHTRASDKWDGESADPEKSVPNVTRVRGVQKEKEASLQSSISTSHARVTNGTFSAWSPETADRELSAMFRRLESVYRGEPIFDDSILQRLERLIDKAWAGSDLPGLLDVLTRYERRACGLIEQSPRGRPLPAALDAPRNVGGSR